MQISLQLAPLRSQMQLFCHLVESCQVAAPAPRGAEAGDLSPTSIMGSGLLPGPLTPHLVCPKDGAVGAFRNTHSLDLEGAAAAAPSRTPASA